MAGDRAAIEMRPSSNCAQRRRVEFGRTPSPAGPVSGVVTRSRRSDQHRDQRADHAATQQRHDEAKAAPTVGHAIAQQLYLEHPRPLRLGRVAPSMRDVRPGIHRSVSPTQTTLHRLLSHFCPGLSEVTRGG